MFATITRPMIGLLVLGGLIDNQPAPLGLAPRQPLPIAIANAPQQDFHVPSEAALGDDEPADDNVPYAFSETIHRVYRVTAYCDRGVTAAGTRSGVGQCAAPADIPFGSLIYIPELDETFVVTDRTAKRFRNNTVDIFIPRRSDCIQFGRHYLECEITIPADPPSYGSPSLTRAVAEVRG